MIAFLWLLPGCTRGSGEGKAIQAQLWADPVSLDPALAEDGLSLKVLSNVHEGLFAYDGGGKLKNALAEKVEISPDGKVYRFRIRERATWSDGAPVTAEHFVLGLRRSLAPQTPSKLADFFHFIGGARDYRAGKAPAEALKITAAGPKELVIELERPVSYLPGLLTLAPAFPFRPDLVKDGRYNELGPSTGPYKIGYRRLAEQIVLEPNARWWGNEGKQAIPYAPVVFRIVQDDSTALSLFETGKLDVLVRIPSLEVERLRAKGVLKVEPMFVTYFVSFDVRRPPFDRAEWRKAVAAAIDREGITRMLGGGEPVAQGWIPPGLEGSARMKPLETAFAPELVEVGKAAKAQARDGKPVVIEAAFDSGARNAAIMEKIQRDLKEKLGMEVRLSNMDWKTYVKTLGSATPQLWRFAWLAPFNDPIIMLNAFVTGNPNNYQGWSNRDYDRLVEEITSLPSGPARAAKIVRAQEILVEKDAAIVPIYTYVQLTAVSPRVENFRTNPFMVTRFDELSLKKPAK